MTARNLRLTLYEGVPGCSGVVLPESGVFFVYAGSGAVTVESGEQSDALHADGGTFAAAGARLGGDGLAWVYEVAPVAAPFAAGLDLLRSQTLSIGFDAPYLVRADQIELPAGAVTPRHGHRGPGIRRLMYGRLMAEVGVTIERVDAGHSWFETGHDMVVGRPLEGKAAFVRVMVLPMELEGGKSSFMPADEIEAAKPRSVNARLFGEVVLPASVGA